MRKRISIAFIFFTNTVFSQTIMSSHEKLAMATYLMQGTKYVNYRPPVGQNKKKGSCIFDFQCKPGFFTPQSDSATCIARIYTSFLVFYVFKNNLKNYDTLGVRFFSWDDSIRSKRNIVFKVPINFSQRENRNDRIVTLLDAIPFRSDFLFSSPKPRLTIGLHAIRGYSPKFNLNTYTKVLSIVLYDYVCERENVDIGITYEDESGNQSIFEYTPTQIKKFEK